MNYPYYAPYSAPQAQNNQSGGIIWIQGENSAKSYLVAPGQTVLLMDSENNAFYIKSADQSGMPLPLRTFDYTERVVKTEQNVPMTEFITRKEFEEAIKNIMNKENTNE